MYKRQGLTRLEAQDVVQETMLAVARNMPAFKYDPALGSFKSWLLNMTRWRIRDQFRKRMPLEEDRKPATSQTATGDKDDEAEGEAAIPTSSDLDKIWDAEWENNLLEAAIAKAKRHLDPQQYQIFDFCVNKEWPPEKVAMTFSIPVEMCIRDRVGDRAGTEAEQIIVAGVHPEITRRGHPQNQAAQRRRRRAQRGKEGRFDSVGLAGHSGRGRL